VIDLRIRRWNSEECLRPGRYRTGAPPDPNLLRCPLTLNPLTTASYGKARLLTKSTVAKAELGSLIPISRVLVVVEPLREEM